jgi:hypothetical protein
MNRLTVKNRELQPMNISLTMVDPLQITQLIADVFDRRYRSTLFKRK